MRALRRGQANRVEGSRRYASPILQWIRRGIIAALAGKQHGVVARWQLLDAGITARQIRLRLTSGRLHEIHRGVYLVGHTVRPPLATEQAALLACGKQATLSHRSAANLWDLLLTQPDMRSICCGGTPAWWLSSTAGTDTRAESHSSATR